MRGWSLGWTDDGVAMGFLDWDRNRWGLDCSWSCVFAPVSAFV